MTDPTPLSPAADAVLDAYMNNCGWLDGPLERDYRCAAAVLRAAVDQVLPLYMCSLGSTRGTTRLGVRQKLIAIAAELEQLND